MRKKTTFIILTIILCMSFVACERKIIAEAPTPIVSPTTVDTKKTAPIEEFYNILKLRT